MKYTPDFSSRFRILKGGKISLVVSALVAGSTMSFAAPTGGQVTTGSASITQSGSVTTINQSTNKASINWNSFSIAPSETVNFVQPSAQSVTLNRVVGATSSLIQGAMNANGQVFLLNPNGVLFANGSQINVGGLVASTLNITDANFQAGKYIFEGNSQNSIINMGTITTAQGGYVAMMGKHVANEGTIVATMGNVQMASGEKISLNLNGNSLVKLTIDKGTLNALVENKGLIKADGGQVYLTTQALNTILDGMVNNTGVIEAQTLNDVTGKVVLFSHGGTANISGTIDASAPAGGNGGFIETSGEKVKIASGTKITTKASNGKSGTWLIDPHDFVISSSGGDITGATLSTNLQNNANVLIESANGSDLSGHADGRIYINDLINPILSAETTLTLKAERDVLFGHSEGFGYTEDAGVISATGNKLNVYISLGNDVTTNSGVFYMENGSSITTNNGNVIVGGTLTGGIPKTVGLAAGEYSGATLSAGSYINAGTGDITIAGNENDIQVTLSDMIAKNITLKSNGVVDIYGSNIVALNGTLNISGSQINIGEQDDGDTNIGTHITANSLLMNADNGIYVQDSFMSLKNTLTAEAGENVDFGNTFIDFSQAGTFTIKVKQSTTRADYLNAEMNDWNANDEAELLAAYNDDEGTNYTSLDEYIKDQLIRLPKFVSLRGGSFNTTLFSDGTQNSINTSTLAILNNHLLAFGNGLEASVNSFGMLNQPFYYDQTDQKWYKLTYSDYPLAAIIGVGGDGTNEWNTNGNLVTTIDDSDEYIDGAFSAAVLNTTGLSNGSGSIVATNTVIIDGKTVEMTNTYTLSSDKALIAMDTKLKNTSGSPMENVRLWVGAQDDWIAQSDETTKERGNLVNGSFQAIADSTERAKALMITGDTSGVLFRTTSAKSNVFSKEEYGSDFYTQDPATSPIHIDASDGAYGVFTRFSDLANSGSEAIRWYYGAGSLGSLADLATAVSQQPSSSVPAPIPVPTPTPTQPAVQVQVNNVVTTIVNSTTFTPPPPIVIAPVAAPVSPAQTQTTVLLQSIMPQGAANEGSSFGLVGSTNGNEPVQTISMEELQKAGSVQGMSEIRVPLANDSLVSLVNGGLNLPSGVSQEFYVVDNTARNSGTIETKKAKKN